MATGEDSGAANPGASAPDDRRVLRDPYLRAYAREWAQANAGVAALYSAMVGLYSLRTGTFDWSFAGPLLILFPPVQLIFLMPMPWWFWEAEVVGSAVTIRHAYVGWLRAGPFELDAVCAVRAEQNSKPGDRPFDLWRLVLPGHKGRYLATDRHPLLNAIARRAEGTAVREGDGLGE